MPLPANFENKLWAAADQLWTNSSLRPSEYSTPVLGLIFLRYADSRFAQAEKTLAGRARRRGGVTKEDYHAQNVLYVPEQARFRRLLDLTSCRSKAIYATGFISKLPCGVRPCERTGCFYINNLRKRGQARSLLT